VVTVRLYAVALLALACACRHPGGSDASDPPTASGSTLAVATSTSTPASTPASEPASAHPSTSALPSASAPESALASASGSFPAPAESQAPSPAASAPFGTPKPIARYSCPVVQRGGPFRSFLAAADTRLAFVDGDDPLALANRSPTGALPPAYAPSDLVDLSGHARTAAECESARECLRRDAATALNRMLAEMKAAKMAGYVVSSFRGFGTQCWVFASWASKARGGFCEATEQSALPGHSQHQLGTTVDLFTSDWAARGNVTGEGVFRNGFGCSAGGTWIDDNAWRFGFVLPYPIHPDDRKDGSRCESRRDRSVPIDPKTGYKNEPWHLRFIGIEAAARYREAWKASGPGTPDEITLEQWLRGERGLPGDAELPVCDGCQCGACATLAEEDAQTPCGPESLRLDGEGRVVSPAEAPHIVDAHAVSSADGAVRVEVLVHSPPHTPTQPPVTDADGPVYATGATYLALAPYSDSSPRRFVDLPGAWRVAIEPVTAAAPGHAGRWPWRASLANAKLAATWNRANVVLPAKSGDSTVLLRIGVPAGVRTLRVTLLHDGVEHDTHEVPLP
jgi:zinc D-Ala-D-Ala carboxypeptidase